MIFFTIIELNIFEMMKENIYDLIFLSYCIVHAFSVVISVESMKIKHCNLNSKSDKKFFSGDETGGNVS